MGMHANPDLKRVLVGNKIDLEEKRKVSYQDGQAFGRRLSMGFFETSAKDGTNVEAVFNRIASEVAAHEASPEAEDKTYTQSFKLTKHRERAPKRSECCGNNAGS